MNTDYNLQSVEMRDGGALYAPQAIYDQHGDYIMPVWIVKAYQENQSVSADPADERGWAD